ncbi:MAG: hypothetical protein ABJA98_11960 [Acidobacteriota bacterium]
MQKIVIVIFVMGACCLDGRVAVTLDAQAAAVQVVNGSGTLLTQSPMFLLPDAQRTPLVTLPVDTIVRVVQREGDWYRVIYHDAALGDRTGYVQAANIRVEAGGSRPPPAGPSAAPGLPAQPPNQRRPGTAAATSRTPSSWTDRGYVSVNGTYQASSNGFTAATTFTQNVEAGSLTATYSAVRPPVLDVGGWARVSRNVAVGAAVTWLSRAGEGTLTAAIPHPFLFNTPRTVTGTVADVPRRELALHTDVSWVVPIGRRVQVAIFGGPSFFQVKQRLVTDVNASSTYPFDTATFVGAVTADVSRSQVGFNAGVDVTTLVSKHVGVGAIVRYSRASVQLPVSAGQEVTIHAGGLQVGGGVRFRF